LSLVIEIAYFHCDVPFSLIKKVSINQIMDTLVITLGKIGRYGK
jgi:hypothetical protein